MGDVARITIGSMQPGGVRAARQPGERENRWSVATYPRPDPTMMIDEREQVVSTERLLWRRDNTLAVAVGREYAIEDRHLMWTQAQFDAYGGDASRCPPEPAVLPAPEPEPAAPTPTPKHRQLPAAKKAQARRAAKAVEK